MNREVALVGCFLNTTSMHPKEVLFFMEKEEGDLKDFVTTFQLIFAAIGGYIGWFLGGLDGLLYALVTFVVLDYITGVMLAAVKKGSPAISVLKVFLENCSFFLWWASVILSTATLLKKVALCGQQLFSSISPMRA